MTGKSGRDCALGPIRSTLTRRSNQAAWPVTGSEFDQRMPSSRSGSSSENGFE
jgi:hypothetical protein